MNSIKGQYPFNPISPPNCQNSWVRSSLLLAFVSLCTCLFSQPVLVTPLPDRLISVSTANCCAQLDLPDVVLESTCGPLRSLTVSATLYNIDGTLRGVQNNLAEVTFTPAPNSNPALYDTLAVVGRSVCMPMGVHTIVYTFTDACGQYATRSFQLTVRNYRPPTTLCVQQATVALNWDDPADRYQGDSARCQFGGVAWAPAYLFDKGSYDPCAAVRVTVRRMEPYSACIGSLNNRSDNKRNPSTGLIEDDGDPTNDDEYYKPTLTCGDPTLRFDRDNDGRLTEYELAISEGDSIKFYCCEVGTTQTVIMRVYQIDPLTGLCARDVNGQFIYNECMVQVQVQDKLRPYCQAPPAVNTSCETFDATLTAYGNATPIENCCLDCTQSYEGVKGLAYREDYALFDKACKRGVITRHWTVTDCQGQTNTCSQRITVEQEQNFYVKFPDDIVSTFCDSAAVYGKPIFYGQDCEMLATNYKDNVYEFVPGACRLIERTWTVINWCNYNPNAPCITVPNPEPFLNTDDPRNWVGPTVSQRGNTVPGWAPTITPLSPEGAPRNFADFWNPSTNCYKYKQIIRIRDRVPPQIIRPITFLEVCDISENDPQMWNTPLWRDPNFQTNDLCEGPLDVCLTAFDDCSGGNLRVKYLLFLDLDQDGKVESVINSTNPPPPGTVYFNNIDSPNYVGGELRVFDLRKGPDGQLLPENDRYRFAAVTTSLGRTAVSCIRWTSAAAPGRTFPAQVPHGRHRIQWLVSDNCGNETATGYDIVIKDCKKPALTCLNGLATNLMNTKPPMATVVLSDVVASLSDNCTPSNHLQVSMRYGGANPPDRTFPTDAAGKNVTTLQWDCTRMGRQLVEVWAKDHAGNIDFCETFVDVQDPNEVCPPELVPQVSGTVRNEVGVGVLEANMQLQYIHPAVPAAVVTAFTDKNGAYSFRNLVPLTAAYHLQPSKLDNPLNGVTTLDIAKITRHLMGMEPLSSPYKVIAADANRSGSITNYDLVELRRLILGVYDELPNSASWRFVDKAYQFPDPDNPFIPGFPEAIYVSKANSQHLNADFVGIKIGDVDGSAVPNAQAPAQLREAARTALLLTDTAFRAGDVFTVAVRSREALLGYQFTLYAPALEILGIVPSTIGMTAEHFAVFPAAHALTVSWNGSNATTAAFALRVRARTDGTLHEALSLTPHLTAAEAYDAQGTVLAPQLRFVQPNGQTTESPSALRVWQNTPNPFSESTDISFEIPDESAVTITVFDETGRTLHCQRRQCAAGYHRLPIHRSELGGRSGVLWYRVETDAASAVRKMSIVNAR